MMASRRHSVPVLLAGLLCVSPTSAGDLGRAAGVAAGIFADIYVHEAGHALAADASGATDIHIHVPGPQCKLLCGQTTWAPQSAVSPAWHQAIDVAGFAASNLAAEALLRRDGSARSAFGQGFIATNLYSNVAHVVTYYTRVVGRNGYRGNDIDGYEQAGGNPHVLAVGMLAYSAWTLHRMKQRHIPVMFVQLRF
jgi:hypothetical protein